MTERLTGKDLKIIVAIVAISFIQGLQYGVSPILNDISKHFPEVSISLVQMLITAPSILAMFVALVAGWLVTKVSRKKLLLFAALASGVTGLMPFLSDCFSLLFISRTIYGIPLGIATALNAVVVSAFFEGRKRVKVMGIQGASVGLGMVVITTISGMLGAKSFETSYLINLIGFISFILLAIFLPETGVVKKGREEPIRLNKRVFLTAGFAFLEFLFLITFTTNISMHLAPAFEGNSGVSGIIMGIFSAAQIFIGFVLGTITKAIRKLTLPAAMLSFAVGCIFLVAFPNHLVLLAVGAAFCGFSQGIFIPTAYVEVSNVVGSASVAMASAVVTCATCIGQLMSAVVLNQTAKVIFGTATTSHIYIVAMIGMSVSAVLCGVWQFGKNQNQTSK